MSTSKKIGLDRSPLHLLHRAGQSVTDLFKREIKSDLTPRQFAVLTVIAENEGCSQTDIVDATGIDRSTIAEMTQRLKTKGLLRRRRSKEDARAYVINLTNKGRRTLKSAEPLAERVNEKILQALGDRRSTLLDVLAAIAARLET